MNLLRPHGLVYRLLNRLSFVAGQLAVFQGASEVPLSESYGRVSNAEKQPTGRGPEGCVENGSAASLLVSRRIDRDMFPDRQSGSDRLADDPF